MKFFALKKHKTSGKRRKVREIKQRPAFELLPNFIVFCFLWVFALIFTQALRSSLSSVLFVFLTLLPFFTLIYLFIAWRSVGISLEMAASEAIKGVPFGFNILIDNDSILPIPFAEADLLLPNKESVRCTYQRVYFSLSPSADYNITKEATFGYRGEYNIGVSNIYVSDFLRFFRVRRCENQYIPIFVIPRKKLLTHNADSSVSDVNTDSDKSLKGLDRAELADIRQYRQGDHMKTIHWKLSSKTQELQVREYAVNSGKTVYIFCDLAEHYDRYNENLYCDDINEYAADGVIELAIAAAIREMKYGNTCNIVWYDSRLERGTRFFTLETPIDLDKSLKLFAGAGLCSKDLDVTKLMALISETQGIAVLFVTPFLDGRLAEGISKAAEFFGSASTFRAAEVYYFSPEDRIKDSDEREMHRRKAEACKYQLFSNGIRAIELKI